MRGIETESETAEDLAQASKATNEIGSGAVPQAKAVIPGAMPSQPSAETSAPAAPANIAPTGHDLAIDTGGATSKALAQKNPMPTASEVRRSSALLAVLFVSFKDGSAGACWSERYDGCLADASGICKRCRRAVCAVLCSPSLF